MSRKEVRRYRKAKAEAKRRIKLIPGFSEEHWKRLETKDKYQRRGESAMTKTADRIKYDRPVDGQAVKIILKNISKFETNYENLHDTPV